MLDIQNPEIKVDEVMQRIQEKVRLRQQEPAPRQLGSATPADSRLIFSQVLGELRDNAQVGTRVPPMTRTHGLKRSLAAPVAKTFLRLAQLIPRNQRAFNQAAIAAVQAVIERLERDSAQRATRLDDLGAKTAALVQRFSELEAKIAALDADAAGARRAQANK